MTAEYIKGLLALPTHSVRDGETIRNIGIITTSHNHGLTDDEITSLCNKPHPNFAFMGLYPYVQIAHDIVPEGDSELYSSLLKELMDSVTIRFMDGIVTLQTAKDLKAAGFKKPTKHFYQDKDLPFVKKGLKRVKEKAKRLNHNKFDDFIYSAPTREELFG